MAGTAQTVYGLVGVGGATAVLMIVSGWLYSRFGPAGFEAWRRHYNEVRQRNGPGRCGNGAFAPRPVAEPSPQGQMQPAKEPVSS
jgi:hypothetical protein